MKASANRVVHFFLFHLPSQLLKLPLIKKSQQKHVLRGWFSMATISQVTDIRTADKSHAASGEKEGKEKRGRFPASLKGPRAWKVAVTHVTFHITLAIIR